MTPSPTVPVYGKGGSESTDEDTEESGPVPSKGISLSGFENSLSSLWFLFS